VEKIKICFVVTNAYSLFDTSTNFEFGGAELRASIFAKEIAKNNKYKVYFVTNNCNQLPSQTIDNVVLLADRFNNASYKINSFVNSLVNNVYNYWSKLAFNFKKVNSDFNRYVKDHWLIKTNADYYFIFSMTSESRNVIDFCVKNNKKYFQYIASNEELNIYNQNKLGLEKEVISNTIQNAEKIIVQNNYQKNLIKQVFLRDSSLIRNPVVLRKEKSQLSKTIDAIWVGKSNDIKRPEFFIQLAKLNPDLSFTMICAINNSEIHNRIKNSLPANLKFIEGLSLSETETLIQRSRILVSTSLFEGFPNTFLQAANYSIPVLSLLVDPDNYISKNNCGFVCSDDIDQLSDKLNILMRDEKLYKEFCKNHNEYVQSNHNSVKIVQQLLSLVENKANAI
jgi:glycosyltransferase involved in cell wall biosynthesis